MVTKYSQDVQDRAHATVIADHNIKFLLVPFHFERFLHITINYFIHEPNSQYCVMFWIVYHVVIFNYITQQYHVLAELFFADIKLILLIKWVD